MKSHRHSPGRRTNRVCVQIVGQGLPIRVSREDAHRLVAIDKDGQYCPKSVFKRRREAYPDWPTFHRINSEGEICAADKA